MKKTIIKVLKDHFPHLYRDMKILQRGYPDVEMRLLKYLCNKSEVSIDVGASSGLYTFIMQKHAKQCIAVEPRAEAAMELNKLTQGMKPAPIIEECALSDSTGVLEMKVLLSDRGRSTIETENTVETLGEVDIRSVPVRTLDSYVEHSPVGLVKIDVEGHEEAVLRGATQIIQRSFPAFLIEAEERHKKGAVQGISSLLEGKGYSGYFILNAKLHPIDTFNAATHQDSSNTEDRSAYINNFLFLHNKKLDAMLTQINRDFPLA